jgi:hypothetical protein
MLSDLDGVHPVCSHNHCGSYCGTSDVSYCVVLPAKKFSALYSGTSCTTELHCQASCRMWEMPSVLRHLL